MGMKARVTKQGAHVPRRMLGAAKEVEIRKENGNVIVIPLPEKIQYPASEKIL